MKALLDFLDELTNSLLDRTFAKVTLSKPFSKSSDLLNVYFRPIFVGSTYKISCVEHFKNKDLTQVISVEEIPEVLRGYLPNTFKSAHLLTDHKTCTLQFNRRREGTLQYAVAQKDIVKDMNHDREKEYVISSKAPFLQKLGVATNNGIRKNKFDKFRQINKYVEIMSSLLTKANYTPTDRIVDMGCGKGYLTFALYEYLYRSSTPPIITGIDLKESVIDLVNKHASDLAYQSLRFIHGNINDFVETIDVIIALHACDIATDIAIAKGIHADAKLIVVAPCCHKQIRKAISCHGTFDGILQNGILLERHAEFITDTIRTWLLQAHGYKTSVFEFVSNEHTAKNLMIAGYKRKEDVKDELNAQSWFEKIEKLKKEYGITSHHLETLLA